MTGPMPLGELLEPLNDLETHINNLPDSPRSRFIGCAFQALATASKVDKPMPDLKALLQTQMGMMDDCLADWAEEDSF